MTKVSFCASNRSSMERFIRGEESRSTEGSGLGLSIARSLTELQGGTFELPVQHFNILHRLRVGLTGWASGSMCFLPFGW